MAIANVSDELVAKYHELNLMLIAEIKKARKEQDYEEVKKYEDAFTKSNESLNVVLGY